VKISTELLQQSELNHEKSELNCEKSELNCEKSELNCEPSGPSFNCNSVVRSHGKMKNKNRSSNFVFNVVGKWKTKINVQIPFSDCQGK